MDSNDQKQKIIQKYEVEAKEKNNEEWFEKGNSPRVPENKASHYFIDRKVSESLKMLSNDIMYSAEVVEIGCSFGHMTSLLALKFEALTAVDISPISVEIAEKRLKKYGIENVRFIADDAESLDLLKDKIFDIAFSFSTIRFCPNPHHALKALHKKLKPGGIAIIDFPNRYSPWHIIIKSIFGIAKHVNDNLYTKKQVQKLFIDCGYKIEISKTFLFTTKRLPAFLLPFFKFVDFVLERLPITRNMGAIIMVKAKAI